MANQKHLLKFPGAHKGTISAITYGEGPRLLSCGVDRTVKLWDTTLPSDGDESEQPTVSLTWIRKFPRVDIMPA